MEKAEKKARVYKSFVEENRISLPLERGGELLILLKVNEIRLFKLEFYLNGKLIKPENLNGKHIAYKRWAELTKDLIENSEGTPKLTPEG